MNVARNEGMHEKTGLMNEPMAHVSTRICVVAADATRARLFTFEDFEGRDEAPTQEFRERMTLVDPARRRRASELFSDTRPGLDRAPSGRGFALDDHRDAARDRMDRGFAASIADAMELVTRAYGCTRLILAASPRMLGILRTFEPLGGRDVERHEIDRDLVRLSGSQLHDHLAQRGLLPARERIGAAATP
jgi:protein required for attachment to host cells